MDSRPVWGPTVRGPIVRFLEVDNWAPDSWARGPTVRGPAVRFLEVDNWAPDSWARGSTVRGPVVRFLDVDNWAPDSWVPDYLKQLFYIQIGGPVVVSN